MQRLQSTHCVSYLSGFGATRVGTHVRLDRKVLRRLPWELLGEELDLVTRGGSRCSHAGWSALVLCAGLSQRLFDAWLDIAFRLAAHRG
jgi:hypothetical protein